MISDLQECDIRSMSPSEICLECYQENNDAIWLSYLKCIQPSLHVDSKTITMVINDSSVLVPLRPANHLRRLAVGKLQLCRHKARYCPKKDRCRFAHSEEELNYWRWERAKEILHNELTLVSNNFLFKSI